MTSPKLPANQQLAGWLTHHRHTQSSFARLIGASQAKVSCWIHAKSRPGPRDRATLVRVTGIQFPDQQRPKPAAPTPPVTPSSSTQEILECLRVLPRLLIELTTTGRVLQSLPGVLAEQAKTNQDIHAALELLMSRLEEGGSVPLATSPAKSNGMPTRA